MFRYITAIVLMAAFTVQTFHGAVIVIDYYINTSSFARNCENKAKPVVHCNGKCQMMKQLKAVEKDDRQNQERKFENKNEIFSSKSFFATLPLEQWDNFSSFKPGFISMPVQDRSFSIFHPPSLV